MGEKLLRADGSVLDSRTLAEAKAERRASIEAEVERQVLLMLPEGRTEIGLLATSMEIQDRRMDGPLTPEDEGTAAAIRALWDRIKTYRTAAAYQLAAVEAVTPQQGNAAVDAIPAPAIPA